MALLVVVLATFTTPTAEQAEPQLRLTSLTPFVVAGSGFRGGEAVRVTVRWEDNVVSAKDVAGRHGRIDVRFSGLRPAKCATYGITARGNKGSRAVLGFSRPCGIDP